MFALTTVAHALFARVTKPTRAPLWYSILGSFVCAALGWQQVEQCRSFLELLEKGAGGAFPVFAIAHVAATQLAGASAFVALILYFGYCAAATPDGSKKANQYDAVAMRCLAFAVSFLGCTLYGYVSFVGLFEVLQSSL